VSAAAGVAAASACGTEGAAGFDSADAASTAALDDGAPPPGDAGAFDASSSDASTPPLFTGDASGPPPGQTCGLGAAGSIATDQSLNLFGQTVYYLDGGALPAGRYRATYVDGCMKYDFIFNWTVQQGTPTSGGWFFVGASNADRIAKPPGTGANGSPTAGGFADFDACVAANLAEPPVDFTFDGGPLGVFLDDNPYTDNVAGEQGRNPKWRLTYLASCPPGIAPQ
jgi:hypothetical protein